MTNDQRRTTNSQQPTASSHQLHAAAELLARADRVACLTGAGVSAESGVATFRDAQTGHWSTFDPQKLASQAGFAADPGLVWRWYMERLLRVTEEAEPNPGHLALAQLEQLHAARDDATFTLITQNVDNLHERAGSRNVIHLHGTISRFRCNVCAAEYALQPADRVADMPPRCLQCGGPVRPDVVWFGELLPGDAINAAWAAAEACEVMLVVGTSAIVYPAAHLPTVAQDAGATIIDINPEPSALHKMADLFLAGPSGAILPRLVRAVEQAR